MMSGTRMIEDRIIIALDVATRDEVGRLCEALAGRVRMLKVGLQLFVSEGPPIVRDIQEAGFDVFLDLKLHDIPNQVARACAEVAGMGVSMVTVHASGGREMLQAAVESTRTAAAERGLSAPKIVGVTVLTSLDQRNLAELGVTRPLEEQVLELARLALDCGLDGIVASAREVRALREALGPDFVMVTPGVRPAWAGGDDQKRVMQPREAILAGASYLVVGRPVTGAPDPRSAVDSLLSELAAPR
ncbi:MAG: orotidine-5'-phosphate decarboxylase [Actinobacteria bacterium]|nr:MAG: orotidine-5'-phosphate decarboxylase [Actinomycetota bacterium]